MDWLESAFDGSDEENENKGSKNDVEKGKSDKYGKSASEAPPFPKVIETSKTVKHQSEKGTFDPDKDCKHFSTSSGPDRTDKEDHDPTSASTNDGYVEKSENEEKLPGKGDSKAVNPLFSIATGTRKVEKLAHVKIKSQELTESELEQLSKSRAPDSDLRSRAARHNLTSQYSNTQQSSATDPNSRDGSNLAYEEKLDYNEAIESFNKTNVNFDKLLKSNQWLGPKIKITDIKADDLRESALEKARNYTCDKNILYEGAKKFSLPTRLMETDDGQVITTNVARRTQKRKHQINWLAMEAQDKEAEIMERTAHMRKSKRETQMKYGW